MSDRLRGIKLAGMSVVSHGIDLVDCARIADLLAKHPDRFTERVFTPKERARADELKHPVPHLAGRFAAKEAILKVLGTGWRGNIAWTDMEITNNEWGQPLVRLTGHCAERAAQLGIDSILLSISHTDTHAMASAIGIE